MSVRWVSICLLAAVAAMCVAVWPRGESVSAALVRGDWEALRSCSDESAAGRVLRGYGCVLGNRTLESTRLWLALDDRDRCEWRSWTAALAAAHPENAFVRCMHGDALARAGEREAAMAELDRALALDGGCVPALLCRGVVGAALGRDACALESLSRACELAPYVADVHASMGIFKLARGAAQGAERALLRAVELDPEHALARTGLACAQWARGDLAQAVATLERAWQSLPLPLTAANLRQLLVEREAGSLDLPIDSPWLRTSDFLDWNALRELSRRPDDALRAMNGGELPALLDASAVGRLNRGLCDPQWAARVQRTPSESSDPQAVAGHQRAILEDMYPLLIANHLERGWGTQLTMGLKLVDIDRDRAGKSSIDLLKAQNRIDNGYRPLATAMEEVPIVGIGGRLWNQHLDNATAANNRELDRRGITEIDRPHGGVTLRADDVRTDDGTAACVAWYGLLLTQPLSSKEFHSCSQP